MKVRYDPNHNGHTYHVLADEPNECPICKHSLKPTVLCKHIIFDEKENPYLYVMYVCTHCYKAFICQFSNLVKSPNNLYSYTANKLELIEPKTFQPKVFDKYINQLSCNFVNIYNQAYQAECLKLDEIAGIGYRKALEFLIKDFLIKYEHIEASKVKPTALGTCIETMINNPQLKKVASRAAWLGNDQTHYEQKYQDKDINDFKLLIDLSVHWITMLYLTDEAETIEKI